MRKVSIYEILDPETEQTVYVGQTMQGKKPRLHQHKYNQTELSKWIRALNKSPIILIVDEVSPNEADKREIRQINKYPPDQLFNTYHSQDKNRNSYFLKELKDFLKTHSAICKSPFAKEAGITPQYLNMILRGDNPLTLSTISKLKPVMEHYGYNFK